VTASRRALTGLLLGLGWANSTVITAHDSSAAALCLRSASQKRTAPRAAVFAPSARTPAAYRGWGYGARPRGPRAAALTCPSGGSASVLDTVLASPSRRRQKVPFPGIEMPRKHDPISEDRRRVMNCSATRGPPGESSHNSSGSNSGQPRDRSAKPRRE
jgi:hypothetical protein